MGKEEILNLNTFLLAGIPEIITQEEFDDVKKAIFEMLKENKKLQQENKKLHHYKTLYQSLKKQKEELRSWLKEDNDKIKILDANDNSSVKLGIIIGLGMCVDKMEELEGVSNE